MRARQLEDRVTARDGPPTQDVIPRWTSVYNPAYEKKKWIF